MSTNDPRISAQRLEMYLDGLMSQEEKAEFEQLLKSDSDAAGQVELQREIDIRLRRKFPPSAVVAADIEQLVSGSQRPDVDVELPSHTRPRRWLLGVFGGLAATVACALFVWQWGGQRDLQPYFRPRPLAEIYRETVESGFRPYYFCEDDDRFQLTFAKRQNVPLRLAEMPAERRMIGLSYSGGLSRDTTAILCFTQEKPIVVFVDRSETDTSIATDDLDPNLHLFRKQLGDLVLYEVSPLETATILDFLIIPSAKP